jgi:hypothetical protein
LLLRGPHLYKPEQVEYLSGKKTTVTDRGALKDVPLRQSLEERLQVVPDLLARAVNRRYALPSKSLAIRKLRRTIELRDSIIHPRWDKYLPSVSAMEAAQAVDAVELYLDSVWKQLHPYLIGYVAVLPTIRGFDKHDVAIGHRTAEKRVPKTRFTTMTKIGIVEVLVHEWVDRRVEGKEINIDLGTKWGEQLQKSYLLRNAVVHAPPDKPIERVSLLELRAAATAVRSYFEELVRKASETFKAQSKLLSGFEIPDEADLEALIKAERIRWDNLNSRF